MTRDALLRRLDRAWRQFKDSYSGLSDAELLEAGVTGAWSVRDIIAHVTSWEEEALRHLPVVRSGQRPPKYSVKYGGIDAFNALMADCKRNLTLSEVFRQQDEAHNRLIDYLRTVPEDLLSRETRFRHRLRQDPTVTTPSTRRPFEYG